MRGLALLVFVALATVLVISSSRSQPSSPPEPANTDSVPEPITGTPVMPNPGSESVVKDPFSPYDIGPPEAAWSYDQLTSAEKVAADHGRDVAGWQATHDAYRAAVILQSARAQAAAAAQQLGVAALDTLGVVP